jgi:hypothetical protein
MFVRRMPRRPSRFAWRPRSSALLVVLGLFFPRPAFSQDTQTDRSFLFKEVVVSGFLSIDGIDGLPRGDLTKDHFEFSPRPPGSYVGVDFVKTFTPESPANRWLPKWLPVQAMDLHPRLVWDRTEQDIYLKPLKFAPQDLWVQFNPWSVDRLSLRVGQFVIPFGANPILAPRQRFQLPIEATDLGLKWDWGLDLKGPIGAYDWEVAATLGLGNGWHSPRLFADADHRSFLFTGRIGSPTYWDFQHGVSFLFGDFNRLMATRRLAGLAISRWRVGYDVFWKRGLYLMTGAQITYGEEGFSGRGRSSTVLGLRAWVDWIVPSNEDLRLSAQVERVHRSLVTAAWDGPEDLAAILEARYSLTTSISAVVALRKEFQTAMDDETDAIYFSLVYYAR